MKTHRSTAASLEANKAVVRRYFETFNAGDFERLDEILARAYGDRLEGQAAGIVVIRSYFEGLKASFPDIEVGDYPMFGQLSVHDPVDLEGIEIYAIASGLHLSEVVQMCARHAIHHTTRSPKDTALKQFQQGLND